MIFGAASSTARTWQVPGGSSVEVEPTPAHAAYAVHQRAAQLPLRIRAPPLLYREEALVRFPVEVVLDPAVARVAGQGHGEGGEQVDHALHLPFRPGALPQAFVTGPLRRVVMAGVGAAAIAAGVPAGLPDDDDTSPLLPAMSAPRTSRTAFPIRMQSPGVKTCF
eukprot:CAMPEP_0167810626 /NCGR_PEP_ID=MMETSP0112_2-20121227/192_1 /TAXON_ID=91324 /ORGANISM="Lotharella globosa, Strain CCCM811" /LENGTH=164 /DNA_ID=CAMNT_0007709197 /DNA_START=413 /DNA_END=909 /DNA_ORIENTATION=-